MVELEKRGIPTLGFVADHFIRDARRTAETFGLPELPFLVFPQAFSNQPAVNIESMVDERIDGLIEGLLKQPTLDGWRSEIVTVDEEWLFFHDADMLRAVRQMNEAFLNNQWSDGFPMFPPTREALQEMLSGSKRDPDEVVAVLEPGFGIATIRKIAANAVMAGCRPQHMPIVIAAIECLADPRSAQRAKAISTGPAAPMIIVNGPIAEEVGLNSGCCVLGPGAPSFANTVIGRALRLSLMNLGHVYPGLSDMDVIGSPAKYSMCLAENESSSPWESYATERGYGRSANAVTVQWIYGLCDTEDLVSTKPEGLIETHARTAKSASVVSNGFWLTGHRADPRYGTDEQEHHFMLISPAHAAIFHSEGWTKQRIKREMYRKCRMPFRVLISGREPATLRPEMSWMWDSPETMLPILEDEECFDIVVVGAGLGRDTFCWGMGGPITKEVFP